MIQTFVEGVSSLLLPASCVGCALPLAEGRASPLCPQCLNDLPRSKPPWCFSCGRSLAGLGAGVDRCVDCASRRHRFDQAISACSYKGPVQQLILALKYKGRFSCVPFLGELLTQTVKGRLGHNPADAVIPVPLHPTRLRERGFNQAQRLAQELARRLDLPLWDHLLVRRKATRSQSELDRSQRERNVREAFGLKRSDPFLRSSRLLLVDDVFTTGATAHACAFVLKEAGAARVTVVTVAHG